MPLPRFESVDPTVGIKQQMETADDGPVVLLNTFTVTAEDAPALLENWKLDSETMKRQPGFISAQLHRGVGANVFVNYAVWESLDHFRAAFRNPEFQSAIADYPASTVTRPVLLKTMAVAGICVA